MNIDKLFNQFLDKKKIDLRTENTIKTYEVTLNALRNIAHKDNMNEEEFHTLIFDYLKLMYEKNYEAKTVSARRSNLRQLIEYAVHAKYISKDFSDEIECIKETKKEPNSITISEVVAIYERLDQDVAEAYKMYAEHTISSYKLYCTIRNKILFETLMTLGERASQIVAVKWEDIDYKENLVKIKNKKSKIFMLKPVPQEYIGAIMNYKIELERLYKHADVDYVNRSEYIFFSLKDPSKPITVRQVERIISSVAKRAGIVEDKTPHSIRHTYASLMVAIDLTTATELLGHKHRTTTASIYSHTLGLERKRDVVNKGLRIILEAVKNGKTINKDKKK